jgi:hypothetical protein
MKEQQDIVCVKPHKARFMPGKRTEGVRILQDFFTKNQYYIKGLTGYIVIKSEDDAQEAIALTFWIKVSQIHCFWFSCQSLLHPQCLSQRL